MKDATMSRRHFEFVAGVVDKLSVPPDTRRQIALDFARAFEGCNKSFHRDMFINACLASDMKKARKMAERCACGQPTPVSEAQLCTACAARHEREKRPRTTGEPAFYND